MSTQLESNARIYAVLDATDGLQDFRILGGAFLGYRFGKIVLRADSLSHIVDGRVHTTPEIMTEWQLEPHFVAATYEGAVAIIEDVRARRRLVAEREIARIQSRLAADDTAAEAFTHSTRLQSVS